MRKVGQLEKLTYLSHRSMIRSTLRTIQKYLGLGHTTRSSQIHVWRPRRSRTAGLLREATTARSKESSRATQPRGTTQPRGMRFRGRRATAQGGTNARPDGSPRIRDTGGGDLAISSGPARPWWPARVRGGAGGCRRCGARPTQALDNRPAPSRAVTAPEDAPRAPGEDAAAAPPGERAGGCQVLGSRWRARGSTVDSISSAMRTKAASPRPQGSSRSSVGRDSAPARAASAAATRATPRA